MYLAVATYWVKTITPLAEPSTKYLTISKILCSKESYFESSAGISDSSSSITDSSYLQVATNSLTPSLLILHFSLGAANFCFEKSSSGAGSSSSKLVIGSYLIAGGIKYLCSDAYLLAFEM